MLDSFIDFLQHEKRYSTNTLVAYRKDIESFFEYSDNQEPRGIKHKDIRGWMLHLLETGFKSSTVNRKLSSLRTYFNWLLQLGLIDGTPIKLIVGPKKEKRLPVFVRQSAITREQMSGYFTEDFESRMLQLMIEVFYQTGMRLSEFIELRVIDLGGQNLKVKGKGNKERLIPISVELNKELLDWVCLKEQNGYTSSEFLFSLKNGKKLYPSLVYRRINNYLSSATDVSKRSPHVLRHTFATHLLNNGAGLEVIKELLGHASLAATQVYTHNSFAELTKIYSQAHPRGRKN